MLRLTFFCILIVLLCPSAARADGALAGQVVSIDQKRGTMTVRLPQPGAAPGKARRHRDITVVTGGRAFPAWLRTGLPIRLQGAFEKGSSVFKALTIESDSPDRFPADPTGVRRRLGRHDLRQKHDSPDIMRGMHQDNGRRHGH